MSEPRGPRPINPEPSAPRPVVPQVDVSVAEPTPAEHLRNITTTATSPPEPPPEPKVTVRVISGLAGVILGVLGVVIHTTGVLLTHQGMGDSSTAKKAEYLLGRNLDLTEVFKCGTHCYFVGDYQINVELKPTYKGKEREVLPWYLELYPGHAAGVFEGKLPKNESKKSEARPWWIRQRTLSLPRNITPPALRVIEQDLAEGSITFQPPDGKQETYLVRDREEVEKYPLGSYWVIRKDITEPSYLANSVRLDDPTKIKYLDPLFPNLPSLDKPRK